MYNLQYDVTQLHINILQNKRIYSFDEKPVAVKSKRGRKAFAVKEGHIDVTGRTHIMTVRRSNPPAPKKKTTTPKAIKQSNNYCRRCEQNDEYIDILNDRICKLENLVEKLTKPSYDDNDIIQQQPQSMVAPNFTGMGIENLLNLSSQINVVLLERFDIQNQLQLQTSMITPITPITPIHPITLTPPVSPFSACEAAEITDWSNFASYNPY